MCVVQKAKKKVTKQENECGKRGARSFKKKKKNEERDERH
jgi:hypothetical protein